MRDGDAHRRSHELIQSILAAARRHMGMEVAHFSEFVEGRQVIRQVEGDAESFGLAVGTEIELDGTYCQRLILGRIPNVVPDVSRDEELRDLETTRRLGIGAYVGAPVRLPSGDLYGTLCCLSHHADSELLQRDADLVTMLAQLAAETIERAEIEAIAWRSQLETESVSALLSALEARDGYTAGHSESVVDLALAVANGLDLPEHEIKDVVQVARLHDLGKIGVPDSILRKRGPLDAYEWRVMREHPVIGARIVGAIPALKHLAPAIRAEHERWDGGGYPDGIAGAAIPVASRIVFVCDSYHAMVSDRPYRKAMPAHLARRELSDNAGTQFWSEAVDVLLQALGPPEIQEPEAPRQSIRTLIVDDDPSLRQLIRLTLDLDSEFAVVGEAGDGAEALAFADQERPDAVVLDLSMPVMDGIEALPKLRATAPDATILVFSASDDDAVRRRALDLGADAFLPKGGPMGDLSDHLMEAITKRRNELIAGTDPRSEKRPDDDASKSD